MGKYILSNKKNVKRGAGMWKWIKTIQATKHEHALVTENKNIQSELREAYILVMDMRVNGQPTS